MDLITIITTILIASIPPMFGALAVWLDKRTAITLNKLDAARDAARILREEKNKNIAEQTTIEIMSKIEETVKNHSPKCELIHAQLESDMLNIAEQKVAEGLEAHRVIVANIEAIREDIKVILTERTQEEGIRKKYESIRLNALKVFFHAGCKNFAIYKADAFYNFIIDNMKTIYQSKDNFENAICTIGTLYITVKEQGYILAGKKFTDCFYHEFHQNSTAAYLDALNFISKDSLNNKEDRFIDVSMNYMQQFLSEMVMAYQKWQDTRLHSSASFDEENL